MLHPVGVLSYIQSGFYHASSRRSRGRPGLPPFTKTCIFTQYMIGLYNNKPRQCARVLLTTKKGENKMGLDMYLSARKSANKYDYSEGYDDRKEGEFYTAISSLFPAGLDEFSDYGMVTVDYPIGYWRKANAIHGWFVKECGGGVDEGQDINVSREQLVKLRDLCVSVMREPVAAGNVLPPTKGFFFGSQDIDEWYIRDMGRTVEMLDHILSIIPEESQAKGSPRWSFVYWASW